MQRLTKWHPPDVVVDGGAVDRSAGANPSTASPLLPISCLLVEAPTVSSVCSDENENSSKSSAKIFFMSGLSWCRGFCHGGHSTSGSNAESLTWSSSRTAGGASSLRETGVEP